QHLAPQGHVLLEYSHRRAHLFAFHESTAWHNAHAYEAALAEQFGLDGIEVYPKRDALHALRMPGCVHPKTRQTYPIVDLSTGEVVSLERALSVIRPIAIPDRIPIERQSRPVSGDSHADAESSAEDFQKL